jgi:HAE1 family hydrophobic/amphiphilic exporter-1
VQPVLKAPTKKARLVLSNHRSSSIGCCTAYDITCNWRCATASYMMLSFVAVLGATLYMFVKIPKGFIPDQDTDQLTVITEAAQGTSYYQMIGYEQQIAEIVAADPNVESLMASVGGATAATLGGPNYGQLVVHLKRRP